MAETRKASTLEERLTPCEICGFPLTHRHHVLMFNDWGENPHTMQLCASCHELFHIAVGALVHHRKRSTQVWDGFCKIVGDDSQLFYKNHPKLA